MSILDNLELKEADEEAYGARLYEEFQEQCKEKGLIIVLPGEKELQIDIDSEEQYKTFQRNYSAFCNMIDDSANFVVTEKISHSGLPHRHITIKLTWNVFDTSRIALQAALGSDPMRELLSMVRVLQGIPNPTAFAEKPE